MNYDDLAASIAANKYNTGNIYWDSLQLLEDNLGGVKIQNATSPLATLLAHSVVMGVVNNEEVARLERMESPEYSSNFDELSRFIPYQQLSLIYALPSIVPVTLYLGLQDLINVGILEGNVRKAIVPKDTLISHNSGVAYGFHHDLLLTLTDGTIIDAVYQDNNNPLVPLLSPVVKATKVHSRDGDGELGAPLIALELEMYQFTKATTIAPVVKAAGFTKTLSVPSQYYHARVYTKQSDAWVELRTAFSDFNYNPHDSVPTAVVKHLGDEIEVVIPYIYITNGLVTSEVKIELYSTNGEVSVDYSKALPDEFTIDFKNTDPAIAKYVAPLKSFTKVVALSTAKLSGGRNLPDFVNMRSIVAAANINAETITEEQLQSQLTRLGYTFIHQSNYLTENVYLASKALDTMKSDGADVLTLGGSMPILLKDLTDIYGVKQNGNNRTITPNAIMLLENEQAGLLSNSEGAALDALSHGAMVEKTNANRYLSPVFYHVFELSDETNELHVYHLSTPSITKRNFIGVNANAEGTISIDGVSLVKGADGYDLVVRTLATSYYQAMASSAWVAQVNAVGYNGQKVALNHTGVTRDDDGNYTFVFHLGTNYDIRDGKGIVFDNLTSLYGDKTYLRLDSTLRVAFNLVANLPTVNDDNWANEVDSSKLPAEFQVVSLEDITVKFGTSLSSMHRPIRTMAGEVTYQRYAENVMAYHPEDIPETDADGFVVFNSNPAYDPNSPSGPDNAPFLYPNLHTKGDPIMVDGVHQVKYYAGLPILDETTQQPIPLGKEVISIETALVVGDYRLKAAGVEHSTLSDVIVANVETDIDPLRPKMIQLSELYYSIARTVGTTTVRLDADTSRTIRKDLSFVYDVVVDAVTYSDADVRALIKKQIKETTAKIINGTTRYVENELTSAINSVLDNTVLGFKVISVNDMKDMVTFSLSNKFDSIGVAPKLYVNTAGQLAIDDDITVNFKLDQ